MSYTLIKRFHAIYFTILLKCWLHLSSQTCSSSFANSELYVGCGRVCAIHPCCCYCRSFDIRNVCCASCMRWPLHCIDSWSYINLIHYWIGSQSFRVIILMWFFFRMFVVIDAKTWQQQTTLIATTCDNGHDKWRIIRNVQFIPNAHSGIIGLDSLFFFLPFYKR